MRNWAIQLISYCEKIANDPGHFFLPVSPFRNYPDVKVPKIAQDQTFTTLVDNLEIDLFPFLDLISALFKNISDYFEKMLTQFLLGGDFGKYGDDDVQSVAVAPLSNCKAESVFRLMKYLFHKTPSMSINTRMVYVQSLKNKVYTWLESKSLDEQDKIIQNT